MKLRSATNSIYTFWPRKSSFSPQCRVISSASPPTAAACYRQSSFRRQLPPAELWIRLASSAAAATAAVKSNRHSPPPPAKPSVPARSPTSFIPLPQTLAKLNPPDDTYPPLLAIPTKKPNQNRFAYLYQCGKLYLSFYKQGTKNVRSMAQRAKVLRQKQDTATKRGADKDLGVLTRAEWQIVRRSRADVRRLPPFGLLVLLFGEWLPLLALYITPLIPEPCRIPAQIERTLRKTETRRRKRERRLAIDAVRHIARDRKTGATNVGSVAPQAVSVDAVKDMDFYTLISLSTRLDCHSGLWDVLFLTPPKWLLRWAVRRRLEYLRRDDGLIVRDGGWEGLGERELRRACVERGVTVLGRQERDLRREMTAWLKK